MDDIEIIQQCIEREVGAWNRFVDRFSSLIFSLIHKSFQHLGFDYIEQDAEDVLENVLIAFVEKDYKLLRQYDSQYRFSTWVGVIVRTQVGRYLRKRKEKVISIETLRAQAGGEDRIEEMESDRGSPTENLFQREEVELLHQALQEVGFKERLILTLAYFDEKDYKEIAEALDISVNSVGAYLYRAKNKLSKVMKKLMGDK